MKSCVFVSLLLLSCSVMAQPETYVHIPQAYTGSSSSLAGYIQKNFKLPSQQIHAAYRWVTSNIKYDKDSMLYINWSTDADEKIAATLRRKKGVCDNFASVFADLLVRMQIPAHTINGLTLQNGRAAKTAHSWVAVKEGSKWLLCDPTWDVNYYSSPIFFLISPREFINTHWPFDPMWQVSSNPISLKDFESGHSADAEQKKFENIDDSIQCFLALNNQQQQEATTRRMKTSEEQPGVLRSWYGYHNMNLAIIYGEQDMNLYNEAVANLNKANHHLNKFLTYRNNFFKPLKPDEEIKEMLEPVKPAIANAFKKIEGMGRVKENFQYDTVEIKQRLKNTEKKLEQQKDFLQRYLGAVSEQRKQAFY